MRLSAAEQMLSYCQRHSSLTCILSDLHMVWGTYCDTMHPKHEGRCLVIAKVSCCGERRRVKGGRHGPKQARGLSATRTHSTTRPPQRPSISIGSLTNPRIRTPRVNRGRYPWRSGLHTAAKLSTQLRNTCSARKDRRFEPYYVHADHSFALGDPAESLGRHIRFVICAR